MEKTAKEIVKEVWPDVVAKRCKLANGYFTFIISGNPASQKPKYLGEGNTAELAWKNAADLIRISQAQPV